jgi:acyl carrier protein
MTRDEIQNEILKIFKEEFEIESPRLDDDLGEKYEFDSIDALDLLSRIEDLLGSALTQNEKKQAMEIRTLRHIVDYVERMAAKRA